MLTTRCRPWLWHASSKTNCQPCRRRLLVAAAPPQQAAQQPVATVAAREFICRYQLANWLSTQLVANSASNTTDQLDQHTTGPRYLPPKSPWPSIIRNCPSAGRETYGTISGCSHTSYLQRMQPTVSRLHTPPVPVFPRASPTKGPTNTTKLNSTLSAQANTSSSH
jgi:hypothetical protein